MGAPVIVPPLRQPCLTPAAAGSGHPGEPGGYLDGDMGFEAMLQTLLQESPGFLGGAFHAPGMPPPAEPAQAEMFNEQGLFGDVALCGNLPTLGRNPNGIVTSGEGMGPAVMSGEGMSRAIMSGEGMSPAVMSGDVRAGPSASGPAAPPPVDPPGAAAAFRAPQGSSSPIAPSPPFASRRTGQMKPSGPAGPALQIVQHRSSSRAQPQVGEVRSRRPSEPLPAESGATVAQLALRAGGDGIVLIARAQRLNREEQLRLRIAIDALLVRHGLSAREIVINGENQPCSGSEGE
jgi:hypothetical protein